ncbi:MAG: hypothetical protein ACRCXZ_02605 [Patescibacteria group bacterium]
MSLNKIIKYTVSLAIIAGLSLMVFASLNPVKAEAGGGRPVRVCVQWITLPWVGTKFCVRWVTIYLPILINPDFPPIGCPHCGILKNPIDQITNPVVNPVLTNPVLKPQLLSPKI